MLRYLLWFTQCMNTLFQFWYFLQFKYIYIFAEFIINQEKKIEILRFSFFFIYTASQKINITAP